MKHKQNSGKIINFLLDRYFIRGYNIRQYIIKYFSMGSSVEINQDGSSSINGEDLGINNLSSSADDYSLRDERRLILDIRDKCALVLSGIMAWKDRHFKKENNWKNSRKYVPSYLD